MFPSLFIILEQWYCSLAPCCSIWKPLQFSWAKRGFPLVRLAQITNYICDLWSMCFMYNPIWFLLCAAVQNNYHTAILCTPCKVMWWINFIASLFFSCLKHMFLWKRPFSLGDNCHTKRHFCAVKFVPSHRGWFFSWLFYCKTKIYYSSETVTFWRVFGKN